MIALSYPHFLIVVYYSLSPFAACLQFSTRHSLTAILMGVISVILDLIAKNYKENNFMEADDPAAIADPNETLDP